MSTRRPVIVLVAVVMLIVCPLDLLSGNQTSSSKSLNRHLESTKCLKCLCVGSSNCMMDAGCDMAGYCGPLRLCEEYWINAGMRGGDFQKCALNYTCATKTVVAFMNRYAEDCDGDQAITCDDYARIHFQGVQLCSMMLYTPEWQRYTKCMSAYGAMQ